MLLPDWTFSKCFLREKIWEMSKKRSVLSARKEVNGWKTTEKETWVVRAFQLFVALLTAVFNLYVLCVFFAVADMHQIQYSLVFAQTLTDCLVNGLWSLVSRLFSAANLVFIYCFQWEQGTDNLQNFCWNVQLFDFLITARSGRDY